MGTLTFCRYYYCEDVLLDVLLVVGKTVIFCRETVLGLDGQDGPGLAGLGPTLGLCLELGLELGLCLGLRLGLSSRFSLVVLVSISPLSVS